MAFRWRRLASGGSFTQLVLVILLIIVNYDEMSARLQAELLQEDEEVRDSYREWYEEWWLWDLPGRGWADMRYDHWYWRSV